MANLFIVFFLVAADRLFKVLAESLLTSGNTVTAIPGVFGFYLLKGGNSGAAFGILQGKTAALAIFSFIAAVVLLYMLYFKNFTSAFAKWGVILIAAGAIGNLYDRVVFGSVTDYIVFLFMDFPIFNFADALINVGVAMLVIYILFLQKDASFFVKSDAE